MKNYVASLIAFMTLLTLMSGRPAMADARLTMSPEISGIQNVMKVIRHVNLRHADAKSYQSILDIMDIKTQTEALNTRPQPVKASVLNAPMTDKGRKVRHIRQGRVF